MNIDDIKKISLVKRNLWFDFGTGAGGDIFSLAGEMSGETDFLRQADYIAEKMRLPVANPYKPSPSFLLSPPARTTSTCRSPIRSRWKSCPTATKSPRARPSSCASRLSPKEIKPTHSTQSATSCMTANASSNSLTVPYWSITTECFSKAKPSASTTPPTHPMLTNSLWL